MADTYFLDTDTTPTLIEDENGDSLIDTGENTAEAARQAGLAASSAVAAEDSADRAEAYSTGELPIDTFAAIAARTIPASMNAIRTLGYAAKGDGGGGLYVDDALSDAALAAAHPRAVGVTANTRYFRLMADAVMVEQLGGGTAVADNQPALQAAITYLKAVGGNRIVLGDGTYNYRTTTRTSDPALYDTVDDGFPLIVPAGLHLVIEGAGKHATKLQQLSVTGASNNGSWQVVSGKVWRGNGIHLKGLNAAPASRDLASGVALRGLTFDGGVSYGASQTAGQGGATYPANTATGQGWDITHKGISGQADKYADHIRLYDCRLTGWGGEMTYQGGIDTHVELTAIDTDLAEGNGDGFNPCCELVNIRGCTITRVFQALEGWTGRNGSIQSVIKDCFLAGAIQGGKGGAGTYSLYYAPIRYEADKSPLGQVNLTIINSTRFYCGSFTRNRIVAFDTQVFIGGTVTFADGVQDVELDLTSWADKASLAEPLTISPGNAAGSQLTKDVRVRATIARTAAAKAAGRTITYPVRWGGSLGTGIVVERCDADCTNPPQQYGATPDSKPVFLHYTGTGNSLGTALHNVETTPAVAVTGPVLYLTSTAAGTFSGTLQDSGAQVGAMLELRNSNSDRVFAIATSTNGTVSRTIAIPPFFSAKLRFSHAGFWEVVAPPPPLRGTATIDVAAIAANGISAEQTITVVGAVVGMPVIVTCTAAIAANVAVEGAYVSANGTVKFRLRDLTGAGYDPANASYTATVGVW